MDKLLSDEHREANIRLRKMREDLGYSQEKFAHILGINISTYKKIEAYERRISLDNLLMLHNSLGVSLDYIMFGDKASQEEVWNGVLNCTETDKVILFLRLFRYLTEDKPEIFPVDDEAPMSLDDIIRLLTGSSEIMKREED